MNRCTQLLRISLLLAIASARFSFGSTMHPDLEMRIEMANQQIELFPDDAGLYFERGQLNMQHEDWDGAVADFERVLQLTPDFDGARVARGVALFKAGWVRSAKVVLDSYLQDYPEDATALLTRGRALAAVGEHLQAARDLNRAILFVSDPKPDYYLELAGEYVLGGEEHVGDALKVIDAGIERFGPLVTLELVAIDLEIKLARVDQALARLDLVAAQSQRKERYFVRRGEILEAAHRDGEARSAYQAGLEAIDELPLRLQRNKATKALQSQAREGLARLGQSVLDEHDRENSISRPDD